MNSSPRYKIKDPEKYIEYLNSLHMNALTIVPCNIIRGNLNKFKCLMSLTPNSIVFVTYKTITKPISVFRIIPILDILKVQYQSTNETYTISTINDHYFQIQSSNFNIFFHKLNYFYRRLIFQLPISKPIKVEGFTPIQTTEITSQPLNVTLLRYEAVSVQHNSPISLEFGRNLLNFESSSRCYFNFESYAWPFTHPNILAVPLLGETQLSVLRFRNVAPNIICKAINIFLQYLKSLTTIIIEDYEDIQFEQFCFSNLTNPTVVSWSFINIFKYSPERLPSFFKQFLDYQNPIQTFHIEGFNFNKEGSIQFSKTLIQGPAFRTLELLIVRNVSFNSLDDSAFIYNHIMSIPNYIPTLFGFEFTTNIQPISVNTAERIFLFFTVEHLRSFQISNIDLSNVEVPFHLPSMILNVELNHCSFSSHSLIKLLEAISSLKNNICLSLEDIIMHLEDWNEFTKYCEEKCAPFTNISELNWSENILDSAFVPTFCKIFLPLSTIHYFKYNRTITSHSITSFLSVLDHLKGANLWGLEFSGGSIDITRLQSSLIPVIEKVVTIQSLEHLDISNHDLDSDSATIVIQLIADNLKLLQEFSFDGTLIDDKDIFYFLYEYLFEKTPLRSVQRPIKDMDRLFGPLENGQEQFEQFKKNFKSTKIPSTPLIRTAFAYQKLDIFADFIDFYIKYPCTLYPDIPNDNYWLSVIDPISSSIRSIYSNHYNRVTNGQFSIHQIDLLPSPFMDTPFDEFTNKASFKTPALLETFKKHYTKDSEKFNNELSDFSSPRIKLIGTNDILTNAQQITIELATLLNDIDAIREVMAQESEIFEADEKRKCKYRKRHRKKGSTDSIQSMTFSMSSVPDILSLVASNSAHDEDAIFDDEFRSSIRVPRPIEYISKDAIALLHNKSLDLYFDEKPTAHANYIEKKSNTVSTPQEVIEVEDSDDIKHLDILDEEDYLRSTRKWHNRVRKIRKVAENEYDEYEEYEYPDIIKNKKLYSPQMMIKSIQAFSSKYNSDQLDTLEDLREFGQELYEMPLSEEAKAALPILPLPSDPLTLKKPILPLPNYLSKIGHKYIDIISSKDADLPDILDTKRYELKVKNEDTFNYFGNFVYATDKALHAFNQAAVKEDGVPKSDGEQSVFKPEIPAKKHRRKSNHKKKKKSHKKSKEESESDQDETSSHSSEILEYNNTSTSLLIKEKTFNEFGFTIISDSEYDLDDNIDTKTIRINSDTEYEYSDESLEMPTLIRKSAHNMKSTPISYTINTTTTKNLLSPLKIFISEGHRMRHRHVEISRSFTDNDEQLKLFRETGLIKKAASGYFTPIHQRKVTFSDNLIKKPIQQENLIPQIEKEEQDQIFKTIMIIKPPIADRHSKSDSNLSKLNHTSSSPVKSKKLIPRLTANRMNNFYRKLLPPPLNIKRIDTYENSDDSNLAHSSSSQSIDKFESNSDSTSSHPSKSNSNSSKPNSDSEPRSNSNSESQSNQKQNSNNSHSTDSESKSNSKQNSTNQTSSNSDSETQSNSHSESKTNSKQHSTNQSSSNADSESQSDLKSNLNNNSVRNSQSSSNQDDKSNSDPSNKTESDSDFSHKQSTITKNANHSSESISHDSNTSNSSDSSHQSTESDSKSSKSQAATNNIDKRQSSESHSSDSNTDSNSNSSNSSKSSDSDRPN